MNIRHCPGCHAQMKLRKIRKETRFRGVAVTYETEAYVCTKCGLEAGTIASAGAIQRAIADAYRKNRNLLTGEMIRSLRRSRGWTQQQLAERLAVDAGQIMRWESGLIQSKTIDGMLKFHLLEN